MIQVGSFPLSPHFQLQQSVHCSALPKEAEEQPWVGMAASLY